MGWKECNGDKSVSVGRVLYDIPVCKTNPTEIADSGIPMNELQNRASLVHEEVDLIQSSLLLATEYRDVGDLFRA